MGNRLLNTPCVVLIVATPHRLDAQHTPGCVFVLIAHEVVIPALGAFLVVGIMYSIIGTGDVVSCKTGDVFNQFHDPGVRRGDPAATLRSIRSEKAAEEGHFLAEGHEPPPAQVQEILFCGSILIVDAVIAVLFSIRAPIAGELEDRGIPVLVATQADSPVGGTVGLCPIAPVSKDKAQAESLSKLLVFQVLLNIIG